MKGPVLVIAAVAAGVILLALWLIRHRALSASPGTFPAVSSDPRGRRRVVGQYDDDTLCLFRRASFAVRPLWSAQRCGMDLERVHADDLPETAVRVRVTDPQASFTLDLDAADASGLRAWIEAGPSLASQPWWNSDRL